MTRRNSLTHLIRQQLRWWRTIFLTPKLRNVK